MPVNQRIDDLEFLQATLKVFIKSVAMGCAVKH